MTWKRYLRGGRLLYCAWRSLTDFLPVPVLPLQHVFETDLLRRDQAQRRVIDPTVADVGGQAHPAREGVRLAVGYDGLDVHRRREFVDGKMARIDDADAVARQKPQSSIRGLGDGRVIAAVRPNDILTPSELSKTVGVNVRFADPAPRHPTPAGQSAPSRMPYTARRNGRHPLSSSEPCCMAIRSVLVKRQHAAVPDHGSDRLCCSPERPVLDRA